MGIKTGDILDFAYTGAVQTVELPKGVYKLECWGAQGGDSYSSTSVGGKGGYSVGTITLSDDTGVYIYVGGAGKTNSGTNAIQSGGFNGGGDSSYSGGGSGGGASDIRIGQDSLYSRVIVAGAGGGAGYYNSTSVGGVGGGESGTRGETYSTSYPYGGGPGTQTSGGATYGSSEQGTAGSFGIGGAASTSTNSRSRSGGGGGGWYGGGGAGYYNSPSNYRRYAGGGGGGSGYIYTSSTASNYPTGCLLTADMYLTDAQTIAGNASMPSTSSSTETGHSDDGYVRITVIKVQSLNMPVNIGGVWKDASEIYVNIAGVWKAAEAAFVNIGGAWKELS